MKIKILDQLKRYWGFAKKHPLIFSINVVLSMLILGSLYFNISMGTSMSIGWKAIIAMSVIWGAFEFVKDISIYIAVRWIKKNAVVFWVSVAVYGFTAIFSIFACTMFQIQQVNQKKVEYEIAQTKVSDLKSDKELLENTLADLRGKEKSVKGSSVLSIEYQIETKETMIKNKLGHSGKLPSWAVASKSDSFDGEVKEWLKDIEDLTKRKNKILLEKNIEASPFEDEIESHEIAIKSIRDKIYREENKVNPIDTFGFMVEGLTFLNISSETVAIILYMGFIILIEFGIVGCNIFLVHLEHDYSYGDVQLKISHSFVNNKELEVAQLISFAEKLWDRDTSKRTTLNPYKKVGQSMGLSEDKTEKLKGFLEKYNIIAPKKGGIFPASGFEDFSKVAKMLDKGKQNA